MQTHTKPANAGNRGEGEKGETEETRKRTEGRMKLEYSVPRKNNSQRANEGSARGLDAASVRALLSTPNWPDHGLGIAFLVAPLRCPARRSQRGDCWMAGEIHVPSRAPTSPGTAACPFNLTHHSVGSRKGNRCGGVGNKSRRAI